MNKKKIKTIIGVAGCAWGNQLYIHDFLSKLVDIGFGEMIPVYTTDPSKVLLQDRYDQNYKYAKRMPSNRKRNVSVCKNIPNNNFITKRAIKKAFKHTDVLLMNIDEYDLDAYKDLLDMYKKDQRVNIITLFLHVNILSLECDPSSNMVSRYVEYDQFEQMFHYFNGSYEQNSLNKGYRIEVDDPDGFVLKTCMTVIDITMSILLQNHQYLTDHIYNVLGRTEYIVSSYDAYNKSRCS